MQLTEQEHRESLSDTPAGEAWSWMVERLPVWLIQPSKVIWAIIMFFVSGRAVVALMRGIISWGGYVSEAALMGAVLWVTLNNVVHTAITWILPVPVIDTLNYLSIAAFSVLPELIVGNAIVVTYHHWKYFFRSPSWKNIGWVWGVLYLLPTGVFLVMTVITLLGFVQVMASSGVAPQANGDALSVRLAAGYYYAMLEFVYLAIGRPGYAEIFDRLRSTISALNKDVSSLHDGMKSLGIQHQKELQEQSTDYENRLREQSTKNKQSTQEQSTDYENRLREQSTDYENQYAELIARVGYLELSLSETLSEKESMESRIAELSRRRERSLPAFRKMSLEKPPEPVDKSTVSVDDGETLTVTNGETTMTFTGGVREQVLEAMRKARLSGQPYTNEDIARETGLGKSTVAKYGREVRALLERESTREA